MLQPVDVRAARVNGTFVTDLECIEQYIIIPKVVTAEEAVDKLQNARNNIPIIKMQDNVIQTFSEERIVWVAKYAVPKQYHEAVGHGELIVCYKSTRDFSRDAEMNYEEEVPEY